jgi:hypothetical protein
VIDQEDFLLKFHGGDWLTAPSRASDVPCAA